MSSRVGVDGKETDAAARLTRRSLIVGLPLLLAACQSGGGVRLAIVDAFTADAAMYGPLPDERFPIPAVDTNLINPAYFRRTVQILPPHIPNNPGEIVVDPANRYLYHIAPDGSAVRYGVGVGREGFGWSGEARIGRKAEWPTWTPPAEMVARDPLAAEWAGGMPPSLDNPLGARAMYLYDGSQDTLYRIHGTNAPWTIGTAASSGCIRLINQDVIHLYANVAVGTRVTVLEV